MSIPCNSLSILRVFHSSEAVNAEVHVIFNHTVLLSDMTRTMLPGPTISTSFSCQLKNTLIACPPPTAETPTTHLRESRCLRCHVLWGRATPRCTLAHALVKVLHERIAKLASPM